MFDQPPADDPSWPDDTHALMFAAVGQRKYPVSVPVIAEGCERQCPHCRRWTDADEWGDGVPVYVLSDHGVVPGRAVHCPRCGWCTPVSSCAERDLIGLFTCVLPLPPRHLAIAFSEDPVAQAGNAIAAARMARRHARKHGFELA